jgi:hypothetical protein
LFLQTVADFQQLVEFFESYWATLFFNAPILIFGSFVKLLVVGFRLATDVAFVTCYHHTCGINCLSFLFYVADICRVNYCHYIGYDKE